jgi:hypothetical protein
MRNVPEAELTARIHAFLDKKMAEFPDLDHKQQAPKAERHHATKLSQVAAALFGLPSAARR